MESAGDRTSWLEWRRLGAYFSIVALGALHYSVSLENIHFHNLIQHLYFLPLMVLALSEGWRGVLIAAVVTAAVEAPHTVEAWKVNRLYAMDQLLEFPVFCAAGLIVGLLVEKERRRRAALEEATEQLSRVYVELREKVERLKRAERLSAVGQLSAGLAHEIRNPLASLSGAAGILRRGHADPESREACVEIIETETARLNRLLGSFLEFARPRAPRVQPVSVPELLQSVVALADHEAAKGGTRLEVSVEKAVPEIEADPEQLKQVLLNLVLNALQASPEGSVVRLSGSVAGSGIEIAVRDEGPGVETALLNQIFDPFFTTKQSGTGLGLSIATQIVAQHRGEIVAERGAGCGMVFRILIPVRQGAVA